MPGNSVSYSVSTSQTWHSSVTYHGDILIRLHQISQDNHLTLQIALPNIPDRRRRLDIGRPPRRFLLQSNPLRCSLSQMHSSLLLEHMVMLLLLLML